MTPMKAEIQMTGALEPRSGWEVESCPIARALDVVGTRSAFLILREAFYGATRFEQFVERAQISEPVAAARLRELADEGLMEKVPYQEPGKRTRHEYRLTEKGTDLLPALVALMHWGDRWLFPDGSRVELRHADCGSPVGAVLRCDAGHDVGAGELQLALKRRPASAA
jgi:DNA-binding HxlR family transcriptional regulator